VEYILQLGNVRLVSGVREEGLVGREARTNPSTTRARVTTSGARANAAGYRRNLCGGRRRGCSIGWRRGRAAISILCGGGSLCSATLHVTRGRRRARAAGLVLLSLYLALLSPSAIAQKPSSNSYS